MVFDARHRAGIPPWSQSLREQRERRGLSRPALAARIGISSSAVKAFEGGRRRPKESTLNAVIDALGLTRDEANPILLAAGHAVDWYGLLNNRYPADAVDLGAAVTGTPWPVFVSNQAIDILHVNQSFQRVMGVDLSREFLQPGERNFLAQASNPRFANRFDNFDELVTYMIGLVKGDPRWQQSPMNPAPWLQRATNMFLQGDPELVRRVLDLWQRATPIAHGTRHVYVVRIRTEELTSLRFRCSTTIADLWSELSWNEWVPDDLETWQWLQPH